MTDGGTRSLFAGVLRLVPYSGIQFHDVTIPPASCAAVQTRFIEEIFDAEGTPRRILLPLDARPGQATEGAAAAAQGEDPDARTLHPVTGRPVDPAGILELDGLSVAKQFAGRWLPIPYLRFIGRDDQGRPRFDAGPSNWVRAFIGMRGAGPDATVTITLAFDTSLEQQSRFDASGYPAPNVDDAAFGSTFICAESVEDVAPLVAEPWLDSWLNHGAGTPVAAANGDAARASKNLDERFAHAHIARYLTLLRMLAVHAALPEARFTDTIQRRFPIRNTAVDLVLDIGEVETTALLVDVTPGTGSIGYAEQLSLRDLSQPYLIHAGPFPTAVEFDAVPFGDAAASRESGRLDAFAWPSLVRIGCEARRLSLRNNGTEGVTGLSNLRSFLLDDTASPGLWRQSTGDDVAIEHGPMVSGLTLGHVGESGTLLGTEPGDPARRAIADQHPAIRPRFSRSSMLAFFSTELVLHALAQVNAAGPDGLGALENEVRELRQVVVAVPPSLSVDERAALLARVEAGLVLAWRGLGWDHASTPGVPKRPGVTLGLGGDLGAQVAFLHDEVTSRYQGRFHDLLRVYRGGEMAGTGAETLRVASADFGARSTTLSIVDYTAPDGHELGAEWQPEVKVSERLPVGTDAILQAMIWSLVLPAIEARLAACGLNPARRFLDEITGRSTTSLVVEDPYFTRRLNRKVLWPAACGLFALNEHGAASTGHGNRRVTLETLVVLGGGRIEPVAAAFDAAALQAGARGFGLADTSINLRRGQLARVIRDEIREPVLQIGRVVASQTCDLLLLGGDGTRLPVLHETMLAALPVAASRIIDLNRHLNRAAAEAMGGKPMLNAAQMLPALASALERRNLLEVSGFGPRALQLLQAGSPSERQRAALASELSRAEISMTQRALNAPVSAAVRADAAERPRERPDENTGERLATIGGRPGAIPTQGG